MIFVLREKMDPKFNKTIIIGSSCSGKTTLGKRLAKITHAKIIDIDELHWKPNWQSTPSAQLIPKIEKEIWGEPRWIISGNYRETMPTTMPQATCVIWLDYPLTLLLRRMLKRTIIRVITQQEICNGNKETIKGTFFEKNNLFSYTIRTYPKRKQQFPQIIKTYPHLKFIQIKSPKQLEKFIYKLQQSANNI